MMDFSLFLSKYKFEICYNHIKGNHDINSKLSKIFIIKDHDDNKYICKRIKENLYNQNEWLNPLKINKNSVIKFNELYYRKGYYYLISNYNNEKDLHYYVIKKNKNLGTISTIILLMSNCIKDCHDNNIVHLDIKLENFIVMNKNPLKLQLIDFGFSQNKEYGKLKETLGTINYIAPEIIKSKTYSKASDIYSLGISIIYLITKKNEIKLIKDELLKLFILTMISKNPSLRPTIEKVIEFFKSRIN